MKATLLLHTFRFSLFLLLFSGCKTTSPTFSFQQGTRNLVEVTQDQEPGISEKKLLQAPEKSTRMVSFSAQKVKPILARVLPETNTKMAAVSKTIVPEIFLHKKALRKLKDIKDEPVKGPVRTFSGIFLAIGMALLLTALVLALIGTSGAGTLAIIGGGAFVAGGILAIVSLLSY